MHTHSKYILILLLGLLLWGCSSQTRFVSEAGVDTDWARAKDLFARERYFRAQQLLRDITLNYSGSTIIDSAYFYLARAGFEQDDYLVAADDFKRLVQQFPSSKLADGATYYESRCYFELAPDFRLDQSYTDQALGGFQRFLEDYPQSEYADSAYAYIDKCRDKLAHKSFAALKLYFKLEEFASCVIYADALLTDYYDTSWADEAAYDKIRALVKLDEPGRAQAAITDYQRRFPQGRYRGKVDDLARTFASGQVQSPAP
ncbi:MAG: outer membrane protein assembly factor BamD [bacterium]|nr:outer membrane protein assembly factor BamD [bacterium]